jgi:hypothetical protein
MNAASSRSTPTPPARSTVDAFNDEYAVVNNGGQTVILQESVDPISGEPKVNIMRVNDFMQWVKNRNYTFTVNDKSVKVYAGTKWLEDEQRRSYSGIVMDPTQTASPDFYNLWRGWAIKPKAGDWTLIHDHLRDVICAGDGGLFDYLLKWLADCFQKPARKPGTSIVMRSGQGTGKGLAMAPVMRICGSHGIHTSSSKQIVGDFNELLADKLILFADEAFFAGDHSQTGALKTLITEPSIVINPKFIKPYATRSCLRVIMATNEAHAVNAEMDDRRFVVLDVSDHRRGDFDYFGALAAQIEGDGPAAMLEDLLSMDLADFNPRDLPHTNGHLKQKVESLDHEKEYWFRCLTDGVVYARHDGLDVTETEWVGAVLKTDMHEAYAHLCRRFTLSPTAFHLRLKKLCPALETERIGHGPRSWRIPELDETRRSFEAAIGCSIEWEGGTDHAIKTDWLPSLPKDQPCFN